MTTYKRITDFDYLMYLLQKEHREVGFVSANVSWHIHTDKKTEKKTKYWTLEVTR